MRLDAGQAYTSNSQFCRVLRVIEAPRVGQAPKNNREAGVAEPYTPIENMNEIDDPGYTKCEYGYNRQFSGKNMKIFGDFRRCAFLCKPLWCKRCIKQETDQA